MARILLVEDTPHNIDLMGYLLEARGHEVLKASDGTSGVEMALSDDPDLLVLDLQLPDLDGFEVLRRVRAHERLARIPACAVTAYAMVGDRDRVLRSGFDAYLTKPIEPGRFADDLERLLPASMKTQAQREERVEAPPPVDRLSRASRGPVLIVDDTRANLQLVRSILEPFGYEVMTAGHLEDALARCRERQPLLVISDIHMAPTDGFGLLYGLRGAGYKGPVVFLSATIGTTDAARASALGVDVLSSPVEPGALLNLVGKLTGQREKARKWQRF